LKDKILKNYTFDLSNGQTQFVC